MHRRKERIFKQTACEQEPERGLDLRTLDHELMAKSRVKSPTPN